MRRRTSTGAGIRPGLETDLRVGPPADARGVAKRFGNEVALAGVDLRLDGGEILALLGPNGAGKTTLVSILLGLRRADSGVVRLFGLDPRLPAARRWVGAALQEPSFPGTLRVSEIVDLVRLHFPDPLRRDELLERFSLASVARRQAGGLSGGQRRRLAVAVAFVGQPRAVFLDEPSAGLDVESRHALWDVIRDFARSGGAVLLTTHQLDEAEALASVVAVIQSGSIVTGGSVAEIRRNAGETRVRLQTAGLPPLRSALRVVQGAGVATVYTRDAAGLLEELAILGIRTDGLEVTPLSLEEAFLHLTQEGSAR